MRIVLPKMYVADEALLGPVFFLLGPILGGGDWQTQCIHELKNRCGQECTVVVPCYWDDSHPNAADFLRTGFTLEWKKPQTVWERDWLHYAAKTARAGCIIGWAPRESDTHPRDDGQDYAQDTRGEIGEWRGRMMHDPSIRFALGIEHQFKGREVIKKNFDSAFGVDFPIEATLADTVARAVDIALYRRRSIPRS